MRSALRHFHALPTCLLLLLWALVPMVQAQNVIPPSGEWVTDRGNMLSASERQMLTTTLRSYADSTSTQIIIVTVPDLDGAPISEYAIALGQRWQVGQGDTDNGAVILVSRDDREVFIATGFGLEGAIPDVVAGRIIRNIIVPNFRQGRVFAGLSGAVDAMMAAAAGEYTADSPPAGNERGTGDGGGGGIDFSTLYILFIIGYFIFTSFRRRNDDDGKGGRRRRRSGLPVIIWGGGGSSGWGGGSSGGGFGGGGFGGFSGGGGGFGGGGAGGSW